jgi:hypothetical protein
MNTESFSNKARFRMGMLVLSVRGISMIWGYGLLFTV